MALEAVPHHLVLRVGTTFYFSIMLATQAIRATVSTTLASATPALTYFLPANKVIKAGGTAASLPWLSPAPLHTRFASRSKLTSSNLLIREAMSIAVVLISLEGSHNLLCRDCHLDKLVTSPT